MAYCDECERYYSCPCEVGKDCGSCGGDIISDEEFFEKRGK